MQSESTCRPGAAEFPHDNPEIEMCGRWPEGALVFAAGEVESAEGSATETANATETVTETATETSSTSTCTSTLTRAYPMETAEVLAESSSDPIAVFVHAVTEVALAHGADA